MLSPRLTRVLFALVLLAGTLAVRWPALDRQVWNLDEGSTITMAQQVLDGQVLFRDAVDNRTPLVPYVKALVLAVTGDWNTRAIHTALALMLGLTAILLWQTCRRLGHESVGVFSALAFLGLGTGLIPPVDSLCAHTGWFLIFFSAAGFWFFSAAVTRQSRFAAVASGVGFGLAMLAKQPGLLDFGVTVVIVLLLAAGRERTQAWRLLPWMAGGFLLPLVITLGYFHANQALADLKFYAWTYNTQYYVPEVPLQERLAAVRVPYRLFTERMPIAFALGLAAALGLLWLAMVRERREPARAILAWLTLGWAATGLLSTILSGREFTHYSIQVLPGACLACGWSLAWFWQQNRWRWGARLVATVALLSLIVPSVYWMAKADKQDDYGAKVGQAIQRYSRPDERIFVWGYMPELHVFARRLPSTRFIYTNWITGMIPWTNTDWLKDTAYAVIPGTAEQLRQDFERIPPAIVVDTGWLRTYLKYPLSGQDWLYRKVLGEFAELQPAAAIPMGFRIYRRLADAAPGAPFPSNVSVDAGLSLKLPEESALTDLPVAVRYSAGTRTLELYQDGALYRRLDLLSDEAGTAVFHVMKDDLSLGRHRFNAIARGAQAVASSDAFVSVTPARPLIPTGPVLEFGDLRVAPLVATNINGPIPQEAGTGMWDTPAPARIVYARPPGLTGLQIEYKMADLLVREASRWHTDGVDFVVRYESQSGEVTELYRRHLDARFNRADQGLQSAEVPLPPEESGRITLWFSPGKASDVSADWVQLKSVRGLGTPINLAFRDLNLPPQRIVAPHGMASMSVDDLDVYMVHAPSELEFELQPGMHRFTATYGLVSSAWSGKEGSVGATFEVWHLPVGREPVRLYQAHLDPVRHLPDRKPQVLSVELPRPAEGRLQLRAQATHPENNAYNHTYWASLAAEEFPVTITTPDAPLRQERMETRFGVAEMENLQRRVVFIHAPSELVYRLPPQLRRLTGSFGLLELAYSGTEQSEGGRFVIEGEHADRRRVELWSRELDPQKRPEDRGFIPLSLDIPPEGFARLVLRTDARAGHGLNRAWTFWHELRLNP